MTDILLYNELCEAQFFFTLKRLGLSYEDIIEYYGKSFSYNDIVVQNNYSNFNFKPSNNDLVKAIQNNNIIYLINNYDMNKIDNYVLSLIGFLRIVEGFKLKILTIHILIKYNYITVNPYLVIQLFELILNKDINYYQSTIMNLIDCLLHYINLDIIFGICDYKNNLSLKYILNNCFLNLNLTDKKYNNFNIWFVSTCNIFILNGYIDTNTYFNSHIKWHKINTKYQLCKPIGRFIY